MNPLSPVLFWPVAIAVFWAGWRAFQIVSAGFTATRAERSLHRHSVALKGITREGQR